MASGLVQITCSRAHSEIQNIIVWHNVEKNIYLVPNAKPYPRIFTHALLFHSNNSEIGIIPDLFFNR